MITEKLSKNPAVWGKVRTVILALVLAAIAIAAGIMGYRSAQQLLENKEALVDPVILEDQTVNT